MFADIHGLLLAPSDTLFQALGVLDRSGKEIALVCDESLRLLGTVTDGDIRRALLTGDSLHETRVQNIMHVDFTAASPHAGRAEVLDMMRARGIAQVPVLGDEGHLLGLHTLHELVGAVSRSNCGVIMAGGKGTRLRPLTESIPKPMIRVAGRPILERLVLHLVGFGVRDIFLSVNYLSHMVEDHFRDGADFGCRIHYLREEEPLGTGGCLSLLPGTPEDPVLVMNGDLVTQVDVGRILDFHEQGGFTATVGLRTHSVEIPFGVVEVDNSRVRAIEEKPTRRMLVNAGIYVVSPDALAMVPSGCDFPITDLFRMCLERGLPVGAHAVEDEWMDVGRPEELLRANGRF